MEKVQEAHQKTITDFLALVNARAGTVQKKIFEISWLLSPGRLEKNGRLTYWIEGGTRLDFEQLTEMLHIFGAPDEILNALQNSQRPFRQGIGISAAGDKMSYRLYLHGRDANQKDCYEAWRWGSDQESPGKFSYSFHYASTPDETLRHLPLIHTSFRDGFEKLSAHDRFIQMSGYWLRRNAQQAIDQVDIALPWHPLAGTLPGIHSLFKALDVKAADIHDLNAFPLRHIAFKTNGGTPALTLYTSANAAEYRPSDEHDLQRYVLSSSAAYGGQMQANIFSGIPGLPLPGQNEIGDFYNGAIDRWKYILGEKMHYHAGFFKEGSQPSDRDMDQAMDNAVTALYPLLPSGGTIYDIGCGWGGPLSMIVRDLQCRAVGLTPSLIQFNYVSSLGLQARLGNAEHTLPPGRFDCILLLESFSHIAAKERLLQVLKHFTGRLVMRVNCQDSAPRGRAFGGSMHMISSVDLRKMLVDAGWQIRHWEDTREKAVPSVSVWHRRLQALPVTDDPHIETLRSWTAHVLENAGAWAENNPLIELMAEL